MKRTLMLAGLALAVVPLSACYDDYGYGRPSYYSHYHPRSYGWYDGWYGPVHDGYWGQGGYYYYRKHNHDRWWRDDERHFRSGATAPGSRWRRFEQADRDDRHERRRRDRDD